MTYKPKRFCELLLRNSTFALMESLEDSVTIVFMCQNRKTQMIIFFQLLITDREILIFLNLEGSKTLETIIIKAK